MPQISCGSSRAKSLIAEIARDLDTILVLHADHSFNASTFACREVVSTRAHMYAGVAAGVGALSGSLHGGANAQVMKMLQELRDEKDVPGWVKNAACERAEDHGHGPCGIQDRGPPCPVLEGYVLQAREEAA